MTKEGVIESAFCDIIKIVHHNFGSAEDEALKKVLEYVYWKGQRSKLT